MTIDYSAGNGFPQGVFSMRNRWENRVDLENAIIRKFDANNRFQAVAKAVLLGIVAS